ncbi:MAG: hypothetical protein AUI84_08185 [Delftia sp. 13_1_40CM_3_66_6]|nr:hypothetical protein [Delftia sp.]OLE07676.1 MAG: hypothetical protein AUG53_07140 [Delftia sp. 13_1_20CM_4_67_18]OLE94679.1 MAG: hypothetical protein AUI84_08185 [Delftia sp. 13_1_40CM_3_66_6]
MARSDCAEARITPRTKASAVNRQGLILTALPRPLAYCVRLNSQGAVLPGNTAASVSLCRVWVLSIPRISKLRRACRPSNWMRSYASGL